VCALASRAALLSTAVTRNFLHFQAQGEATSSLSWFCIERTTVTQNLPLC